MKRAELSALYPGVDHRAKITDVHYWRCEATFWAQLCIQQLRLGGHHDGTNPTERFSKIREQIDDSRYWQTETYHYNDLLDAAQTTRTSDLVSSESDRSTSPISPTTDHSTPTPEASETSLFKAVLSSRSGKDLVHDSKLRLNTLPTCRTPCKRKRSRQASNDSSSRSASADLDAASTPRPRKGMRRVETQKDWTPRLDGDPKLDLPGHFSTKGKKVFIPPHISTPASELWRAKRATNDPTLQMQLPPKLAPDGLPV